MIAPIWLLTSSKSSLSVALPAFWAAFTMASNTGTRWTNGRGFFGVLSVKYCVGVKAVVNVFLSRPE